MRVAIIDSGIDLLNLYSGDRHGYEAVWVKVESFCYSDIDTCDVLVVPAGSDSTLLYPIRDYLSSFIRRGGWLLCFDGPATGLFDEIDWVHTRANHKSQSFHVPPSVYSHLLDGVAIEGLECKDGVRGWWCEGELNCKTQVPVLVDDRGRVVASVVPSKFGTGGIFATAAGRLPIFSKAPNRASNIFFANLLRFCDSQRDPKRERPTSHIYIHSGNWAHRSFLRSSQYSHLFEGFHWNCLNRDLLERADSIWIPWESNIRGVKRIWPLLQAAVANGAVLVIEDLRENWLPGFSWEQRPVDSSWWREGRSLDLEILPTARAMFPTLTDSAYAWHYHGVFDCPRNATALLLTADKKTVLAHYCPVEDSGGSILVSTLDATFEYGVGKIPETSHYIDGVLDFISRSAVGDATSKSSSRA